jgi:hypothetical protein
MPGKRVQLDDETWQQLDLLGRDQMKDFQELADEAFRDLVKKALPAGRSERRATPQCRRHRNPASVKAGQSQEGAAAHRALIEPSANAVMAAKE